MAKRTIIGQRLASTGPVSAGKPIPTHVLEELFKQGSSEQLIHQHHDASLPVIGKLYNKRLEKRPDGTLAILADIEFFDDNNVDLSEFKGFSISYLGEEFLIPSAKVQAATICLDTRFFDDEDLLEAAGCTSDLIGVSGRKLYRYSVTATVVTIVVTFISLEFAKGFFSQAGKNLFTLIQDKIASLASKQKKANRNTEIDFTFSVEENGHTYEVLVRSDPETLALMEANVISIDDLRSQVMDTHDPSKVRKIVARLSRHPPYLRTERVEPVV